MADGMVLHPGHDELHGITVVVTGASGRLYVGRWHERQERGVILKNATVREAGDGDSDAWLASLTRFGIPSDHRMIIVPDDEFLAVRRLSLAQPERPATS